MKKYNFISGLPRSGSTLLSSILNQNPRFTAGISDPLHQYTKSIIQNSDNAVGIGTLVNNDKRKNIIRGIFDSFYRNDAEVCFNTNRSWCSETSLLKEIYPDFKMIAMVRDVRWVLNSFEVLHQKNPFTIKPLYLNNDFSSVYERTHSLMGNMNGGQGAFVAGPLNSLKQAMFSTEIDQICFVEFTALVKNPESTMRKIYNFLNEKYYDHDFNNVETSYDEYDREARFKDLHTIRRKVEYKKQNRLIPDDLWMQFDNVNFWKNIDTSKMNWIKNN